MWREIFQRSIVLEMVRISSLDSIGWSGNFNVIYAGISPDGPITRQYKDNSNFIRTWNPKTRKISNEAIDAWWYQ